MRLVNDNQVIVRDRNRSVFIRDQPHHALHCGNLQTGFRFKAFFAQLLHGEDLIQGEKVFELDLCKLLLSLLPKEVPVHEKENTLEAFCRQKPIDQREGNAGFTGAGRHGEENGLLSSNDGFFRFLHSFQLIVIKIQAVRITKGIIGRVFKLVIRTNGIRIQPIYKSLRTRPAVECAAVVYGGAGILEPDA